MFLESLQNSQKNIFTRTSFLIKLQAGKLKLSETATGAVQKNKLFLKISQVSQEFLFNKVAILSACNFIKKGSSTGASLWNVQDF